VTATPARPAGGYLAETPGGDQLRLFCFHHAGGSATGFAEWQEGTGPDVTVLPVQLPGRENRVGEPRFRDMDPLVTDLQTHLGPHLRPPFAFYGHSMGALVSYALTVRLISAGAPPPSALLVGAYPSPDSPALLADALRMSDLELGRLLVAMGGMSEVLLSYPDWLGAATSIVRDDLQICTSHRRTDGAVLPCPVHVFAGADDSLVTAEDARRWTEHTSARCTVTQIPGGHFFPRDSPQRFFAELRAALRRHAPSPAEETGFSRR
jgi:surfactin synthase thioesterase subunit